jgi:hypothetical protein
VSNEYGVPRSTALAWQHLGFEPFLKRLKEKVGRPLRSGKLGRKRKIDEK